MSEADLDVLSPELRASVRLSGSEVLWPVSKAADAVNALADAGRVVLGIDIRDYGDDGAFVETAWSDASRLGSPTIEDGRRDALIALARPNIPGQWVLVTWECPPT